MVLTDTGYWLALASPKDKHHQRAVHVSHQIDDELITTWPVVTETCHLLAKRLGTIATVRFLEQLPHVVTLFELTTHHLERVKSLMLRYQNLPMDLADASLVIAAEELGQGSILSTDRRDFQAYRWKNHHPFKNLLFPDD